MKDIILKTTRAGLVLLDLGLTLYLALEQRRARRSTEDLLGALDRLTAAVEAASKEQCEDRHVMLAEGCQILRTALDEGQALLSGVVNDNARPGDPDPKA